jgi:hypothetical protein
MFEGGAELRRQAPMGHQHHTDHFERPLMERSASHSPARLNQRARHFVHCSDNGK